MTTGSSKSVLSRLAQYGLLVSAMLPSSRAAVAQPSPGAGSQIAITPSSLSRACGYGRMADQLGAQAAERDALANTSRSDAKALSGQRMVTSPGAADPLQKVEHSLHHADSELRRLFADSLERFCLMGPVDSLKQRGITIYSSTWRELGRAPSPKLVHQFADSTLARGKRERALSIHRAQIRFARGSAALVDSEAVRRIRSFVAFLREQQSLEASDTIFVRGYADVTGPKWLNDSLAMARATTVALYMVDQGVPLRRIALEGEWASDPSLNATELNRATNRSVEIRSSFQKAYIEAVQNDQAAAERADLRSTSQLQRGTDGGFAAPPTAAARRAGSAADLAADLVIDKAREQTMIWLVRDATSSFCGDSMRIDEVVDYIKRRDELLHEAAGKPLVEPAQVEELAARRKLADVVFEARQRSIIPLPATCQLFRHIALDGYPPSLATIRAMVRQDLRGVPELLAARILTTKLAAAPEPEVREAALATLFMLYAVHEIDNGTGSYELLAQYPEVRARFGVAAPAIGPADGALLRVATFAAAFADASRQLALPTGSRPSPDSVAVVALKVLAVNRPGELDTLGVATLLTTMHEIESLRDVVRDLRRSLTMPVNDTIRGNGPKVQQYAQLVANATDMVTTALRYDSAVQDDARYDRLRRAIDIVHGLALAMATDDYHGSLYGIVSLNEAFDAEYHAPVPLPTDARTRALRVAKAGKGGALPPAMVVSQQGTSSGAVTSPTGLDYRKWAESMLDSARRAGPAPAGSTDTARISEARLRTLVLLVDVVTARDEGDVQSAFGRYQGGAWGYREKRRGPRFWTINGYLGASVGMDVAARHSQGAFAKPFVPLGVEYGTSRNGFSHSLLIDVIDVGAIAVAHVTNSALDDAGDRYARLPVFGAFYVLGLRDNPLSVGIGPQLTAIRWTDGSTARVMRLGIIAGVDAPLIHLR